MSGTGTLLPRRNIRLETFLKRNTELSVFERIRAYEPCVVVSDAVRRAYMYAVLSDERVYLTEHAPRTLTAAVSFGRVLDIELINDFPDFLHGKDRELCQHIRITYMTEKPVRKGMSWMPDRWEGQPPPALPSGRSSSSQTRSHISKAILRLYSTGYPVQRDHNERATEEVHLVKPPRLASCLNLETLGPQRVLHPPSQPPSIPPLYSSTTMAALTSSQRPDVPKPVKMARRLGFALSRLFRKDHVNVTEYRKAELHLYALLPTSRLYLHLQSSWNSFIIRSTLLLDSPHKQTFSNLSPRKRPSSLSWERTASLFAQLTSELLQAGDNLESFYLLLQELRTAACNNVILRRLFWRSNELCIFLVWSLEENLHSAQTLNRSHTADQLLLSTLIVQTLAIMFRETENDTARLCQFSANNCSLASRMLLALLCDPELHLENQPSVIHSELQALLAEYLDAACSLLFELLLLGHEASKCSSVESFLSVGWVLRALRPHPHLLSFISFQAQQMVLVLSDVQASPLSPTQSVLLFQRSRLLLACLQHENQLARHLQSSFREEFRYFVKPSCAGVKLPPNYPISQPTLRVIELILALILQR